MRKYDWKIIVINAFWLLAGVGVIVLLGAAMLKKDQKTCQDVKIEIIGVGEHIFIDEKDVLELLKRTGQITGKPVAAMDLRQMESLVEKNPWVKNAEMYIDNNQVLQVRINERQPVARVFTLEGSSFYLDSTALRLPLSEKLSARVPVFTGFPSDRLKLAKPDSALLEGIVIMGRYILADSFWMAQISQVAITPVAEFELIPVVGDQLIVIGNTDNLSSKFRKLFTFYRKAWLQNGMNAYEKLDLRFDNQVVAIKKGTDMGRQWSNRTDESLKNLMASLIAGDTLKSSSGTVSKAFSQPSENAEAANKVVVPKNGNAKLGASSKIDNKGDKKTLLKKDTVRRVIRKQLKKVPPVKIDTPKAVMLKKGTD